MRNAYIALIVIFSAAVLPFKFQNLELVTVTLSSLSMSWGEVNCLEAEPRTRANIHHSLSLGSSASFLDVLQIRRDGKVKFDVKVVEDLR